MLSCIRGLNVGHSFLGFLVVLLVIGTGFMPDPLNAQAPSVSGVEGEPQAPLHKEVGPFLRIRPIRDHTTVDHSIESENSVPFPLALKTLGEQEKIEVVVTTFGDDVSVSLVGSSAGRPFPGTRILGTVPISPREMKAILRFETKGLYQLIVDHANELRDDQVYTFEVFDIQLKEDVSVQAMNMEHEEVSAQGPIFWKNRRYSVSITTNPAPFSMLAEWEMGGQVLGRGPCALRFPHGEIGALKCRVGALQESAPIVVLETRIVEYPTIEEMASGELVKFRAATTPESGVDGVDWGQYVHWELDFKQGAYGSGSPPTATGSIFETRITFAPYEVIWMGVSANEFVRTGDFTPPPPPCFANIDITGPSSVRLGQTFTLCAQVRKPSRCGSTFPGDVIWPPSPPGLRLQNTPTTDHQNGTSKAMYLAESGGGTSPTLMVDYRGEPSEGTGSIRVDILPPCVTLRENSLNGPLIANGAPCGGQRNFGTVKVGETSAPLTVFVRNPEPVPLRLSQLQVISGDSADFQLGPLGTTVLDPNSNTSFSIQFIPTKNGPAQATLGIEFRQDGTDDPLGMKTFDVCGEGMRNPPKPEPDPCVCCGCQEAMNNPSIFTHSKEPALYNVKLSSGSHIIGFPIVDLGEKTDDVSYNLGQCPPGASWSSAVIGSGSAYTLYHRSDPLECPDDLESGFLGENVRDNFDMAVIQDSTLSGRIMTPDMRQYLISRPDATSEWDLPDGFFSTLTLDPGAGGSSGEWTLRHYSGTMFVFDAPGPRNGEGRLKRVTDAVGNTTTVNRDASGRKTSIVNDLGRAITFSYDGNNRISSITDFLGRQWDFTYDGNNNLSTITLPAAETVTTTAGTSTIGPDVLVHDGDGTSATSIATTTGTSLAITPTYRRTITANYDPHPSRLHHLRSITDDRGATPWENTYNSLGQVASKAINGNPVQFFYDITSGTPAPRPKLEPSNTWTRVIDRESNICDYEIHDENGNPATGKGKFGTRREICWTERGKTGGATVLHDETLIDGRDAEPEFWETRFWHDCDCLAPKEVSQTFRSDFPIAPDPTTKLPTNYPREVFTYNDNRQITTYRWIGFTTGEEIRWEATYRPIDGRMLTYDPPRSFDPFYTGLSFTHTYGYDGEGNLALHTPPLVTLGPAGNQSASESWMYNGAGQITQYIDENGNITNYVYGSVNSPPVGDINTQGQFTGLLRAVTVGAPGSADLVTALTTFYELNALGWTTKRIDPKNFAYVTAYNQLGEVIRKDDAQVTLPASGATQIYQTHYFHDGAGNMVMSARTNSDHAGVTVPGNPFVNRSTSYDPVGKVKATRVEVDPSNVNDLTTEYAYDKNDQMTIVQKPAGNRVFTVYDERRLPFKQFYGVAPGASISTGYPTTKTATNLSVSNVGLARSTWDARFNAIRHRDALGNFSDAFFDFYNRRSAMRDENGNGVVYQHDDGSLVLTTSGGIISTSGSITSTLKRTYGRFDERRRNYQTVLDLNLANNESGAVDPTDNSANPTYQSSYDKGSRVLRSTDAKGNPTQYSYDATNRTTRIVDALNNETEYTYDNNSNVAVLLEKERNDDNLMGPPDGIYTETYEYDELNRRVQSHNRGQGNNIDHVTQYFHDSVSYTRRVIDAENRVMESDRDDLSRRIETRRLDMLGGPVVLRNQFEYDRNSRKLSDIAFTVAMTPSGMQRTSYGYDNLDRRVVTVHPDSDDTITINGGVAQGGNGSDGQFDRVEASYDANSNVVGVMEQRGVVFTNTYDPGNRLTSQDIALPSGTVGETQRQFTYDALNRIELARNDYAQVERLYDPLSRLTDELQSMRLDGTGISSGTWDEPIRIASNYDIQSNRTLLRVFDGPVRDYREFCTFDPLNRHDTCSTDYFGTTASGFVDYKYVGPWRVRQKLLGNDAREVRSYDTKRRIYRQVSGIGTTVLTDFQYGVSPNIPGMMGYDKVDNPLSEQWLHDENRFDNYGYNARYELTSVAYRSFTRLDYRATPVVGDSFTYDDNSNRTEATFSDPFGNQSTIDTGYTVSTANEYAGFVRNGGLVSPSHDHAGNMTMIPVKPANGNSAGMNVMAAGNYDAFNRLFCVTAGTNEPQHMRYDAFGRRIALVEISSPGDDVASGRRYVWDGWRCITERTFDAGSTLGNATTTLERTYLNGKDIDNPVLVAIDGNADGQLDPLGTKNQPDGEDFEYYYVYNRLGSVMGLVDADTGNRMLEYYRYSVHGEPLVLPVVDDVPPFGFEDTPFSLTDNNMMMLAQQAVSPASGRVSRFKNHYMYTGRRLDEKTGLHYYRYRHYEAGMGRFVGRDPAKSPWKNLYGYVRGKVTRQVDPSGLKEQVIWMNPFDASDDLNRTTDKGFIRGYSKESYDGLGYRMKSYAKTSVSPTSSKTCQDEYSVMAGAKIWAEWSTWDIYKYFRHVGSVNKAWIVKCSSKSGKQKIEMSGAALKQVHKPRKLNNDSGEWVMNVAATAEYDDECVTVRVMAAAFESDNDGGVNDIGISILGFGMSAGWTNDDDGKAKAEGEYRFCCCSDGAKACKEE